MATFVFIPGGWCGGWYFEPVAEALRRHGHRAFALTLSGLAERGHLIRAGVNLQTHIGDVLEVFDAERLTDVVVVGHSYAGMVLSGLLDRIPDRIAAALYCDAYVPEAGQSCFEATNDRYRRIMLEGARADGLSVPPPRGSDPRTTAHPLGAFLQGLTPANPAPPVPRGYIYLSGWGATPFAPTHERVRHDPTWRCFTLPTRHDIVRDAPDELVNIALEFA